MTKVIYFLFIIAIFFPFSVFAQGNDVKISGKVIDERTQETIIGASITLAGARGVGTVTDRDGQFTLTVKSLPATLIINYIGYKTIEIDVYEAVEPVVVQIGENTNFLNEVVVVGYGTQKRKELTGAVTSIP